MPFFQTILFEPSSQNERKIEPPYYTCQLSRILRESHVCGLKTSFQASGQFLTADSNPDKLFFTTW